MARSRAAAGPAFLLVHRELERWRRGRRRGERIPASVWSGAVALARELGVGKVSRALRLDYYALQRRLSGLAARPPPEAVDFVEVAMPPGPSGVRCEVTASGPTGDTVRIAILGMSAHELAIFVRTVSGREP